MAVSAVNVFLVTMEMDCFVQVCACSKAIFDKYFSLWPITRLAVGDRGVNCQHFWTVCVLLSRLGPSEIRKQTFSQTMVWFKQQKPDKENVLPSWRRCNWVLLFRPISAPAGNTHVKTPFKASTQDRDWFVSDLEVCNVTVCDSALCRSHYESLLSLLCMQTFWNATENQRGSPSKVSPLYLPLFLSIYLPLSLSHSLSLPLSFSLVLALTLIFSFWTHSKKSWTEFVHKRREIMKKNWLARKGIWSMAYGLAFCCSIFFTVRETLVHAYVV